MSDLTLPIIGLTTLAGYLFSKKDEKMINNRKNVESMESPNGNNIYTSNMVTNVNNEVLQKSIDMYKKSENPSETGVLPPLFNTYSIVGNDGFFENQPPTSSMNVINDVNRYKSVNKKSEPGITDRPMFNKIGFKGKLVDDEISEFNEKIIDGNVSLLTGLPIETMHNNMIPFFGGNKKQNIETFSNQSLWTYNQ